MKINKGSLWFGWDWEKAINEHFKTSDCFILAVYKDTSENLLNNNWVFECYKLMAYGNRFKEYKTTIPNKFYPLIDSLKKDNLNKFKKIDIFGNKIKEVFEE